MRCTHLLSMLALATALQGAPALGADMALVPLTAATGEVPPSPWRVVGVPGGKIALTQFSLATVEGQRVLRVQAPGSYGNLVHDLPGIALGEGTRISWRWRLDEPLATADLRARQGDDSALKVCVLFDMPLERLGLVERNLLRLARAASAEKLPSATLCYVWDTQLPTETVLPNAYTARVRMLVVSGPQQALRTWTQHSRNVAQDFRRAFGAQADPLPPVMAVLVGGDSDNTAGNSLGYVSDLRLTE